MPEKANLDWKTYESITKYIYETLGSKTGVKVLGYGSSCKIEGKSGVSHQIDILTSHSDGIHFYRTAIECKYWKEKISKETVMKLSNILEDTNIEKGIIVSKNGFTKDGAEFAKYKNISLVELREFDEGDEKTKQRQLQIGTLELSMHITRRRPEILSMTIECTSQESLEKEIINVYQTTIKLSNGDLKPLNDFITAFHDELHAKNKVGETITKLHEVPHGTVIHTSNGRTSEIKGITFSGVLTLTDLSSKKEILLEDTVWLIMKSIFDEKTFSILECGLIVENRK